MHILFHCSIQLQKTENWFLSAQTEACVCLCLNGEKSDFLLFEMFLNWKIFECISFFGKIKNKKNEIVLRILKLNFLFYFLSSFIFIEKNSFVKYFFLVKTNSTLVDSIANAWNVSSKKLSIQNHCFAYEKENAEKNDKGRQLKNWKLIYRNEISRQTHRNEIVAYHLPKNREFNLLLFCSCNFRYFVSAIVLIEWTPTKLTEKTQKWNKIYVLNVQQNKSNLKKCGKTVSVIFE